MNCSRILLALLISGMLVNISIKSSAQDIQAVEQRKEQIKRILEEKGYHTSGQAEEYEGTGFNLGAKITSIEQKITASSSSSTNEAEISIAYDPNDSNNIVLSFMRRDTARSFPIYYSNNGGATWNLSTFNSNEIQRTDFPARTVVGFGDPAFAWDKNGKVYFAWIYISTLASAHQMYFTINWSYSNDNGQSWNIKPNHIIAEGANDTYTGNVVPYKDGLPDREWLAVDNSDGPYQGNVYCSFTDYPSGLTITREVIKTLVPGVDTFGSMVIANSGNNAFGNVEVDKNGVVHLSFADFLHNDIRHVASSNGGVSFGPSQPVAKTVNTYPAGGPYIVHKRENGAPSMSVDGPAGTGSNIHVVWSDFPGTTVKSYYAHSTDGGLTWSTPDTLNKYFGGNIAFMPTVAAFGSNVTISLTAIDNNDSARYYQLNSSDNGFSFNSPLLVSTSACNYNAIGATDSISPLFFGDYTRSQRNSCLAYSAWSDGRNNMGSKVYFAKQNYCTLGVKEVTAVNGNVQLKSVFPNPATDKINLKLLATTSSPVTIQILDMSGKCIYTQNNVLKTGNQEVSVPLNHIAMGMYLVSVQDNEGLVGTRNIVVQ